MGPELLHDHPDAFGQWWDAGGWKNFASFMVATGQIAVTEDERRALVNNRLLSAINEATAFYATVLPT